MGELLGAMFKPQVFAGWLAQPGRKPAAMARPKPASTLRLESHRSFMFERRRGNRKG